MLLRNFLPLLFLAVVSAQTPEYIGAGGCASSNCHGGTTALPESQSRILGNEYATWSVTDRHSRAFKALQEPRGKRMAEILKIADAVRDKRCAVCHVSGSPEKSLSDGVACEACHGPATVWLGTHTQLNSHQDSIKKGMSDTKNLDVRAKTCLACHLGNGDRVVDHDLIAAGHPDLAFELDTFTFAQPSHHREPKPAPGNTLPRVRAWAVGQSAALAEGMRLLGIHTGKGWPEFSDLECYQCHHDLRADSWRIQRGYGRRRPGSLQLNMARFEVLRDLVAQAAPEQRAALESSMARLEGLVSERLTDGPAIAEAAKALERSADALTIKFMTQNFDAAMTQTILRAINADIQQIANAGVNAAEQATMSLDALTAALSQEARKQQAISALYTYLEHPSTYRPAEFAAMFQKAAD
jgi:Cytochrome c554 and c-prime